jgi:hypothetical protein
MDHSNDVNIYDALQAYCSHINQTLPPKQAKQRISETESAVIRIILRLLGFSHQPKGRKFTAEDKKIAFEFMRSININRMPEALKLVNSKAETLDLSKSSFGTYNARALGFLTWSERNGFWPDCRYQSPEIQAQCSPKARHGYGEMDDSHLTERRGCYLKYVLQPDEAPQSLQEWRTRTFNFLVRPVQPGRVFGALEDSAADRYLDYIYRIFGYLTHHADVPLDELSPDLIFPLVNRVELQTLGPIGQQELWREHQYQMETVLCDYRDFIVSYNQSRSPHTWKGILSAVKALGRVQYAAWVNNEKEYDDIPIFKALDKYFDDVFRELEEWENGGESVSDWSKKWPEVPAGSTALEEVQAHVAEPLRLECRPRNYRGEYRKAHTLAHRHQHFLKYGLVAFNPPRRVQDDAGTKIALSCPIEKPPYVPEDGCYYPLPPDSVRVKNRRHKVVDCYLYKTYLFRGQVYPEGVWIRDIQGYKTKKKHGRFQVILPNRKFADGRSFYNYLEDYLEGVWQPGPFINRRPYEGFRPEFQGKTGRWITKGRSEFEPKDDIKEDQDKYRWRLGYLFVGVKTGRRMANTTYTKSLRSNSFRLIGKKITHHTFRYMWATWAIQVGLSDAELHSLAYMMGQTVKTLRRTYERCTPPERQKIIEDAINARLSSLFAGKSEEKAYSVDELFNLATQLEQQDLWSLFGKLRDLLLDDTASKKNAERLTG